MVQLVSVFFHVLKPSNAWDMLVLRTPLSSTSLMCCTASSLYNCFRHAFGDLISFSNYCYLPHHNLFLVSAPLVPYWHWSSLPYFLSSLILITPIMSYLFWVDTECSRAFHLLLWTFVLRFVQNFICYIHFYRFYFLVINWKMHWTSLRRPASVLLQPSLSGKTCLILNLIPYLRLHDICHVRTYIRATPKTQGGNPN